MKLLYITYRKLSIFFFLLIMTWGVFFYFTVWNEIIDETDDTLENYKERVVHRVLDDPDFMNQDHNNVMTQFYFRSLTPEEGRNYGDVFMDSTVYVEVEDEYEPVRVMKTSFRTADGDYHELILMLSTLERDDMIEAILFYIALLYVVFFLITTLGTRLVLKKALLPLNKLLDWYSRIAPGKPIPPLDNDTKIEEFRILNREALSAAQRNENAYQVQKRFIENASHELQTPLAIARNKIELLVENESLNEEQLADIDEIYRALGGAVRLNDSLLMLTRIENGQYSEAKELALNGLTIDLLSDLADIYEYKGIKLNVKEEGQFIVKMNEMLARILVSNLVKNAMNYSDNDQTIQVLMNEEKWEIRNPGNESLDTQQLYTRFYRSKNTDYRSNGLGLSIVKSICDYYHMPLNYSFIDGMHIFTLSKKSI